MPKIGDICCIQHVSNGRMRRNKSFSRPSPLNAWYAAARDVDIATALFPRRIIDKMIEAEDAAQRQAAE
jgi:hypothetical protein